MAYKAIYDRYKEDLDGNIIAEYAQTLFLSQGREFNNDISDVLKVASVEWSYFVFSKVH